MRQFICIFFMILLPATSSPGTELPAPAHYRSDPDPGFALQPVVRSSMKAHDAEIEGDGYWFDSWTDEGSYVWRDTIHVFSSIILSGEEPRRLERWDGFYLCGESNPADYLYWGYEDFGTLEPGYHEISISYDTGEVPYAPGSVWVDFAHRFRYGEDGFHGGIPLAGRPACFWIAE